MSITCYGSHTIEINYGDLIWQYLFFLKFKIRHIVTVIENQIELNRLALWFKFPYVCSITAVDRIEGCKILGFLKC